MGLASGVLEVERPFDFAKSLRFIERVTPCAGEQSVREGKLTKALRHRGQTVAFTVEATEGGLAYTRHSDRRIDPAAEEAVAWRIGEYLSVGDRLSPFYQAAEDDRPFAALARRHHGLHQVRFLTPIEIAVWAVLAQRAPMAVARKVKRAFIERFGASLQLGGERHWAFPSLEDLAGVSPGELEAVVKNAVKARRLLAVVRAFAGVDEGFLRRGDYRAAERWLLDVEGLGEWSKSFILLRGLGRMERCPLNAPIVDAARKVYGEVAEEELERIRDGYGELQGYWAYYLRAG